MSNTQIPKRKPGIYYLLCEKFVEGSEIKGVDVFYFEDEYYKAIAISSGVPTKIKDSWGIAKVKFPTTDFTASGQYQFIGWENDAPK